MRRKIRKDEAASREKKQKAREDEKTRAIVQSAFTGSNQQQAQQREGASAPQQEGVDPVVQVKAGGAAHKLRHLKVMKMKHEIAHGNNMLLSLEKMR